MRVVDLDRDMRDVIPTTVSRDSAYLFERMTERTLDLARPGPQRRILDVASGLGQDARALAERGAFVVAAEPSARMSALAEMLDEKPADGDPHSVRPRSARPHPVSAHLVRAHSVRGWADALPFAAGSFDAVICKGAIDHFDAPERAISEMARVTRPDGRVVLAIANFDSFSCRFAHGCDAIRERVLGRTAVRGRRHYDVPHDHFTRYELDLMRDQASVSLELEHVEGVSLGWGMPSWSPMLARLPERVARAALAGLGALATGLPALADVVVLAGRPRRAAATSS